MSTNSPIGKNEPETPQSLMSVLSNLNTRSRSTTPQFSALSTGFAELDSAIGGGLRPGQLILVSGRAGIGKTALTLQLARNLASTGRAACLYICYEHPTDYLLARLISMESADFSHGSHGDGLRYPEIMAMLESKDQDAAQPADFLTNMRADRRGQRALQRISRYGERLLLLKGSSYTTGVPAIVDLVRRMLSPGGISEGRTPIVFVDYLQKIASSTPHTDEVARNISEVEALKELALNQQVVVIAIAAADASGLKASRLQVEHLLAGAALAYEADVIIMMNEKYELIDRKKIDYNSHNAEQFRNYLVLSLEKNRFNAGQIELEVRKLLQYSMFGPEMRRLADDFL